MLTSHRSLLSVTRMAGTRIRTMLLAIEGASPIWVDGHWNSLAIVLHMTVVDSHSSSFVPAYLQLTTWKSFSQASFRKTTHTVKTAHKGVLHITPLDSREDSFWSLVVSMGDPLLSRLGSLCCFFKNPPAVSSRTKLIQVWKVAVNGSNPLGFSPSFKRPFEGNFH